MRMLIYKESGTIYLTHTRVQKLLLSLDNNQPKRCRLDS